MNEWSKKAVRTAQDIAFDPEWADSLKSAVKQQALFINSVPWHQASMGDDYEVEEYINDLMRRIEASLKDKGYSDDDAREVTDLLRDRVGAAAKRASAK